MGLIGKSGIAIAGGVPIVQAAIDASQPWLNTAYATMGVSEKLTHTVANFANSMSVGFGLGAVYPSSTVVGGILLGTNVFAPAGGWVKTTTVGISLVVIDGIIGVITRIAAGGRVRPKIMGRQLISG